MLLRQMNQIKKQYMPTTLQAEAASKLAYANLMGPQFLAKMLGNDGIVANMGDPNAKAAVQRAVMAGMGGGTGANFLAQMGQPQQQQQGHTGVGQPSTNALSGWLADKFKGMFPQQGGGNPLAQQGYTQADASPSQRPPDGVTKEGEQWYNNRGEPVYSDDEQSGAPLELELTKAIPRQPTYAETTGAFKGTVKEGEELGKHRAQVIDDIGQQQLSLSSTGSNLDRIIDDINAPKFMDLRKDFPFYQDMQLTGLSKIGTPEQQEMIGNFIADIKSFAGATVNSFKGSSMRREFEYADQLKPNENDTVNSARGKLTALKTLKEIAEKKNDIILDLLQNKHINIGDAVKVANNMVDDKAIAKKVKKLTSPMISVKNPKTGITIRLPLWEARQRGVKNV